MQKSSLFLPALLVVGALAAGETPSGNFTEWMMKNEQAGLCMLPWGMTPGALSRVLHGEAGCGIDQMASVLVLPNRWRPGDDGRLPSGGGGGGKGDHLGHARPNVGVFPSEVVGLRRGVFYRLNLTKTKPVNGKLHVYLTGSDAEDGTVHEADGAASIVGTQRLYCGSQQGISRIHLWFQGEIAPSSMTTFDAPLKTRMGKEVRTAKSVELVFDVGDRTSFQFKVGYSWVSAQSAKANLAAECPHWDLAKAKDVARQLWVDALSAFQPESRYPWLLQRTGQAITACLEWPLLFSDADGGFTGFDGKPHKAESGRGPRGGAPEARSGGGQPPEERVGERYHLYSAWDTYRTHQPLLALVWPKQASDICWSFIDQARTGGGGFARWSVGYRESGVMEGDPSSIMIASSYALGARDFDAEAALALMHRVASEPGVESSPGYQTRPGLKQYLEKGYVSETGGSFGHSGTGGRTGSLTLEYALTDFALSRFADSLGKKDLAERYLRQSQHWKSLFAKEPGWLDKGPGGKGWSWAEGSWKAYQWMVPHNIPGLAARMGGKDKFIEYLDHMFQVRTSSDQLLVTGDKGRHYEMSNQPSYGMPYIYNWLGQPWKTQLMSRNVVMRGFCRIPGKWPELPPGAPVTVHPKGPGADDAGAMSAWFLWHAIGLYPQPLGLDGLTIASPLYDKITIRRSAEKSLTIITKNAAPENCYVQSLTVNGKPHNSTWLPFSLLTQPNDVLEFTMGAAPNEQWGTEAPPAFDAEPWYLGKR